MTCQVIDSGGDRSVLIGGASAPGRQPLLARPAETRQTAVWGLGWRWRYGVVAGDGFAAGSSSAAGGIAAIESSENILRPSSCQRSSCSNRTAPTRRVMEASLGKMPTTRVRRLGS